MLLFANDVICQINTKWWHFPRTHVLIQMDIAHLFTMYEL